MNLDGAFERILSSLYEVALDNTRWSEARGLIEEALDAAENVLAVVEESDDDVHRIFAHYLRRGDGHPDLMHRHFTVYHPRGEAMPRARHLPPCKRDLPFLRLNRENVGSPHGFRHGWPTETQRVLWRDQGLPVGN